LHPGRNGNTFCKDDPAVVPITHGAFAESKVKYKLDKMTHRHRKAVIDVYNHFVENSFAAYNEETVGYGFYDVFLNMARGYPAVVAKTETGEVVGFGFLSSFHHAPSFGHTACVSYFIHPDHTRRGIGGLFLRRFEKEAAKKGISILLAHISSLNPGSIQFHRKNGFEECGRFHDVGKKFGKSFDMIWVQKRLEK
jgi:L-amino acid N-acyltransferase YncA